MEMCHHCSIHLHGRQLSVTTYILLYIIVMLVVMVVVVVVVVVVEKTMFQNMNVLDFIDSSTFRA